MTKAIAALLFFFAAGAARAQSRIVADISNFRNNNGVCRACLFNSGASFDSEKPLQCQQVSVTNGHAQALFANVPPGIYAILVFHDANNNNQLDKNFFGIPKEGYGASRNNLPFAGAPTFDANKFEVKDGALTTLNIRLRNL